MSKTALIAAVQRLDLTAAKRLLKDKPALVGVIDRQGRNLLHMACAASAQRAHVTPEAQARFVEWVLDQGFEIDATYGKDRCTPLFEAVARARNPLLVKRLIARGAKPSAAPGGGLFAAAWWNDSKSINLLVDAGAEADVVVGITPFLAAWRQGNFEAAKALVLRGADVNYRDRNGKTALHHGIEKEIDPAMLTWLVRHGASPDIEDKAGVSPRVKASRKRDKRFLAAIVASRSNQRTK